MLRRFCKIFLIFQRIESKPVERYCIFDAEGKYFVGSDTIERGVQEGWLKKVGYFIDEKDRLVYTYRHYTGPVNPKLP